MKILVIGKKNHLNWDNHVVDAFKELGCDVIHYQINSRIWYVNVLKLLITPFISKKKSKNLVDKFHIKSIKKKVDKFEPNLAFFTSATFIPEVYYNFTKELKSSPKVFAWEGDSGNEIISNSNYTKYVDVMFDSQVQIVKRNTLNYSIIEHLPFAFNPKVHKNKFLARENKLYFCGANTEDRNNLFSQLQNYKIVFKGWNWNKLSSKSLNFEIHEKTVNLKELIYDYNKYFSVINIHQKENAIFNSDLNMRGFEVPGCGALQICDHRNNISEYFIPGIEICSYKNVDELKSILNDINLNPEKYNQIRENGYKKAMNKHTYKHRMKKVLLIYDNLSKE